MQVKLYTNEWPPCNYCEAAKALLKVKGMVEVTAVFPLKFTIQELTLFPGIQSNNTELGVTFENDRFVGVGHVGASLTSKLSIAISPDQSEPLVPEILN